ncbi:hypothetical protein PHYBOEH_002563 [Phytophthora boehmeriae]|uniref:Uncharacterized protein n=1 Tax=Phytophthora boehmeriae TaxID=109152 RepID=A0A8T1WS06_9STRA|nr:hypothetical protein PHYBOEH_002563 [Phytophthora boehmeriae]
MSVHAPADDFPELNLIMGFDDLDDAELFDADALVSSGDFDSSLSPGVANTHNTVEDFFVDNASSNRNMSQEILDKIASRKADLAVRRRKSRQRVKSSREALQRQAKELTDELARRKQAQKMRQIRAKLYRPATYFIWKHVAARELRERRQAEAELRSLTEAFEVQKAYIATLSGQARKWSSDHEVRNVKKLRNETEDDAFWNALSRDLEMDCSRVDEVFSECGMATLPESGATLRSIKKSGVGDEVEYYELVKKFPQSSSYLKTESIIRLFEGCQFGYSSEHTTPPLVSFLFTECTVVG